jgi:hypothetical protein
MAELLPGERETEFKSSATKKKKNPKNKSQTPRLRTSDVQKEAPSSLSVTHRVSSGSDSIITRGQAGHPAEPGSWGRTLARTNVVMPSAS